eukprot:2588347-Rhodomonas_salina.1
MEGGGRDGGTKRRTETKEREGRGGERERGKRQYLGGLRLSIPLEHRPPKHRRMGTMSDFCRRFHHGVIGGTEKGHEETWDTANGGRRWVQTGAWGAGEGIGKGGYESGY